MATPHQRPSNPVETEKVPLVSIGMPVYNGQRFLCRALDSLLAQHHRDFDLLISDNASTDATADICLRYAARDGRIKYSRAEQTVDAAANFNRVLSMAAGRYFMWAAADDLWEPGFIATLLSLLEAQPDAVAAFCAFDTIDEDGARVELYDRLTAIPSPDRLRRQTAYLLQDETMGKANLIYALMLRSAIRSTGGFESRSSPLWGADMLLVFRLLSYGDVALTGEVLFHKRRVAGATATDAAAAGGIVAGIRRYVHAAAVRLGYVAGCARVIRADAHLSTRQKIILPAALVTAMARRGAAHAWRHLRAQPHGGRRQHRA